MDDLISRQALLEEYDRLHVGEPGRARKLIEDAPSVQPEIIRCDECRYYIMKSHRCEPLGLITCDGFWCKQAERRKNG